MLILTQPTFIGEDVIWQYAAIDSDGRAFYYSDVVHPDDTEHWCDVFKGGKSKYIGSGFDTSDWYNSFIKREV